jgi:periplasmic protein TonB
MPLSPVNFPQVTEYRKDLSQVQRSALVIGILLGHVGLGWGLMQVSAVREVMVAAAPMMFSMVQPDAPPKPVPPPPTAKPIPKVVTPTPLIAVESPAAAAFVVAIPPPDTPPAETSEAISPSTVAAPPAPAPKIIPASAIDYLVRPPLEYPRASSKLREAGRVIVRVYVDEGGIPRVTQVKRSSGFVRLDEAALDAVQKARFKPYVEHGVAVAGWALIPLDFDLEF